LWQARGLELLSLQSALVEKVVESVLQTGKTVTLAVKSVIPLPGGDIEEEPDWDEDSREEAVQ
jgi:ribosomal protein S10